jgi:hypothetical protein
MDFRMTCRLAAAALLWIGACNDDSGSDAPLAPGGGSGTPPPSGGTPTPPDAGDADEDAGGGGDDDLVLSRECMAVDPVNFMGEDTPLDGSFYNAVVAPDDFSVTRVETTWAEDCETPTIRLLMSDGRCSMPGGHVLEISMEADAIERRDLVVGQNLVQPEPANRGLQVRYTRPSSRAPAGTWGNCEGADGNIDFIEIGAGARDDLQAQFQFLLTPCDESTPGTQSVQGTFDVVLRRGVDEACPAE